MSDDENSFTLITSPIERKAAFDDLVGNTSFITGLATGLASAATILLRASHIEELRQLLYVNLIEESALLPGGSTYLFTFHIPQGQFQFEAALKRDGLTPLIELNKVGLQRLQRRGNFRTSTGPLSVSFRARKPLASGKSVPEWRVLDVSVGGFALVVSSADAASMKIGQHLEGALKMNGREDLKVKAVIKHIDAPPNASANSQGSATDRAIGLKVLDMDQSIQRNLLSMGLQIHRETKNNP